MFCDGFGESIIEPAGIFEPIGSSHPVKKIRTGGSQRLHIDTLMIHARQAQIEIGKFAFRLSEQGPIVAREHVAVPLVLFQLETVRSAAIARSLKAASDVG